MITDGNLTKTKIGGGGIEAPRESVFDRFAWFYAFCREQLFRDDTEQIIASLWPEGRPRAGECVLEIGCGPGFYATRLARRFPAIQVTGIDRCAKLLEHSKARARLMELVNCRFEQDDIYALARADGTADVVVLSRLLMMLDDRARALSEVHRVLRPGGACFVAEPRSPFRAAVPLGAMWAMVYLLALGGGARPGSYGERRWPAIMDSPDFESLVNSRPWASVRCWSGRHYHYALCRK
jgi:arsenite methyltransferase